VSSDASRAIATARWSGTASRSGRVVGMWDECEAAPPDEQAPLQS
jgi:hypothetical protein